MVPGTGVAGSGVAVGIWVGDCGTVVGSGVDTGTVGTGVALG